LEVLKMETVSSRCRRIPYDFYSMGLSLGLSLGLCFVIGPGSQKAQAGFPEDWFGRWTGQVEFVSLGQEGRAFSMMLEIRPIPNSDHLSWRIQYEGEPVRNYEMIPTDPASGHYLLDEKNGILIDHYFINGALHSMFVINGKSFETRLELVNGKLSDRTVSYDVTSPRASGGQELPTVHSFAFRSCQSALLTR
jgi:hypothetical protein